MLATLQSAIANQQSAILILVYISLTAYLLALAMLILGWRRAARVSWTAGAMLLLVHVAAAFHWSHHWSHLTAYEHTAAQTAAWTGWNWGGGLWLNYLATAGWLIDAAWWWLAGDDRYSLRKRWLNIAWHGFLAFMWFNGAVVFAEWPRGLVSLLCFVLLLLVWRVARRRSTAVGSDDLSAAER